jgi:hypothetical protein
MELGAAVAASTEVKRRKSGALAGLVAGVFSHPRAQKLCCRNRLRRFTTIYRS